MNELCNKLAVSIDSLIKLRDVNGKGVTRALMYMKKVAQLDLQKASDEKYYIAMLNKIRNAIVHTGGILHTEPSSDIYRFINNEIFISISADGALIIHDDFIDRFIGILIGFFDKLDSEIQMFIERYDAQPNS
ncbi:hypothetical protein [Brumicola blandensis]|uniref:Apea-like HEPN domain-containing protein n=1 Tax=Brumicola blandensis TaxID=3075611 RepID=A0AAW8QX40_9ALTE|nr:hypothetical protein [Alteromonas sp. W409]MDT0581551.1 hypothetical protein [Alteromonas sp. W409]